MILLFSNCVQEFDPPAQGYQNLLVVDAFLSDSEDPFEVRLSRSFPIDTLAFIPEAGAVVSLFNDSGEIFNLVESDATGVYVFNGNINAQVGRSYTLQIQTRNGNQYASSSVTMIETPDIDSVTFKLEERPTAGLNGVQIYVNTHDPNNTTWYYRWDWDEAWEFRMPYNSYLIWEDQQIKTRDEQISRCWKFGRSTSIDISTSKILTEDRISNYPLTYVSTETDRLGIKYSIRVKQFALSEKSYNFWKEMQRVSENLGTLFDPQPSIIRGNIKNIEDESEVVLGYFQTATVSEQRIFIRRTEIHNTRIPNYFSNCMDSLVGAGLIPAMVEDNWMLVQEEVPESGFPIPSYLMSTKSCIDCRLFGTNKKPEYWD